jgi:hypothetical protein
MQATQEEFQAAYGAWRAATEKYDRTMADAMAGVPTDWPSMHTQIKELERLHQDWLIKSKPFVRWKPSLMA